MTTIAAIIPLRSAAHWLVALVRGAADRLIEERDRWVLWLPVFFGLGIGGYFALHEEPNPWLAPLTGAAVLAAALLAARVWPGVRPFIVMVAMPLVVIAAGFADAQLRTLSLATPILAKRVGPVAIEGTVTQSEAFPDGSRLTISDVRAVGARDDLAVKDVRLRLRGQQPSIGPGERIRIRSVLMPPPPPAAPGAFDFQRHAYFEGLSAVGFAVGRAEVLDDAGASKHLSGFDLIERLRFAIAERIRVHVGGAEGAMIIALLIGEQTEIPQDVINAMRDSGLAHILSISGLHIGIVAGLVFFAVRAVLALIPWFALRFPIKKWAAVAAIAAAGFYTLVAGMTVPTERSFLMVGIVFMGVLLDRRGLSMRIVAIAAFVVLVFQPESMLGPSFQMSFAAVIALIAAFEWYRDLGYRFTDGSSWRSAVVYVVGIAATTIIASTATAPFAAYHFGRLTWYAIAANVVAVPLSSLWIMPWAVVSMLLMPFGLEGIGLVPMSWGVTLMIRVAQHVAAWPGSVATIAAIPTSALALIAFGGLWLCLWRRPWRLAGLVIIAAGFLAAASARSPDVFVGPDGKLQAVRAADGSLIVSSPRRAGMIQETWARRTGQAIGEAWPRNGATADGRLRCDGEGCIYHLGHQVIALSQSLAAVAEDCRQATVIVATVPVYGPCPAPRVIVDRFDLWRDGGHALWFNGDRVRVESVNGWRGERPWVLSQHRSRKPAKRTAAPQVDEAKSPADDDDDDDDASD